MIEFYSGEVQPPALEYIPRFVRKSCSGKCKLGTRSDAVSFRNPRFRAEFRVADYDYTDKESLWNPAANRSLILTTASHNSIPFRLMAVIFGLAVLYHAAALSITAFAKAAYTATYPPLRHVAFVIVNSLAAFLFLKQPRWLIWPYLVLTVQVLQGHGVRLWRTWVDEHQINWIDAIVISGVLLGLALLFHERTRRDNGSAG